MLDKLFSKLNFRKEEFRILIPKELDREDFIGGVHDFHKVRDTFTRDEIGPMIFGKKVRYWKQVYKGENRKKDLFVPIFWKVAEKKVKRDYSLTDF